MSGACGIVVGSRSLAEACSCCVRGSSLCVVAGMLLFSVVVSIIPGFSCSVLFRSFKAAGLCWARLVQVV